MKHTSWIIAKAGNEIVCFYNYTYNKLYMKILNAIKREKREITIRESNKVVQQVLQGVKMMKHASYLESSKCTFVNEFLSPFSLYE